MTKAEFLDKTAELMEETPGSLKGNEKLESLPGVDSVFLLSFIALADASFGVRISPRQFAACSTVDDLAKLVNL